MIIKKHPEDFIVEEIPLANGSTGPYAIFLLWKKGLTTEQALDTIVRKQNISRKSIKYAGIKDKQAVTTQYISIYNGTPSMAFQQENISITFVTYSDEPKSLGSLAGNRFTIIVRDISPSEKNACEGLLKIIAAKGSETGIAFENYFDEQRFSETNIDLGLAILKKQYADALKLLRAQGLYAQRVEEYAQLHPSDPIGALKCIPQKVLLLYINAVQSYVFNETLTRIRSEQERHKHTRQAAIRYGVERQGILRFFNDSVVDPNHQHTHSELTRTIPSQIPLIGFDQSKTHPETELILQELGITHRDFIIRAFPELSQEGILRDTMVEAKHVNHEWIDVSTLKISFELPKGSYATMFLKYVFAGT